MYICDVINQAKKSQGITNQEIALRSGLTLSTIDKITSGNNDNPKLNTLLAICKVLGITLDDLTPDKQKTSPSAGEPTQEDAARKLSVDEVINSFVSAGLVGPDEDLTDEDLQFLIRIIDFIRLWFAQKQKKGG